MFGATLAALFAALPKELVLSIAALALFGSIINGLSIAMTEVKEREAALITFMVTASGLTLFSIGSAFWGIVAGVLTLVILNWRKGLKSIAGKPAPTEDDSELQFQAPH